jgi:hypothetical protein
MAATKIDPQVHPYGLGGSFILSGSASGSYTDVFDYYPLTSTTAAISMSAGNLSGSWGAGIHIYGQISQVSQSSGIAILYRGITQNGYTYL